MTPRHESLLDTNYSPPSFGRRHKYAILLAFLTATITAITNYYALEPEMSLAGENGSNPAWKAGYFTLEDFFWALIAGVIGHIGDAILEGQREARFFARKPPERELSSYQSFGTTSVELARHSPSALSTKVDNLLSKVERISQELQNIGSFSKRAPQARLAVPPSTTFTSARRSSAPSIQAAALPYVISITPPQQADAKTPSPAHAGTPSTALGLPADNFRLPEAALPTLSVATATTLFPSTAVVSPGASPAASPNVSPIMNTPGGGLTLG